MVAPMHHDEVAVPVVARRRQVEHAYEVVGGIGHLDVVGGLPALHDLAVGGALLDHVGAARVGDGHVLVGRHVRVHVGAGRHVDRRPRRWRTGVAAPSRQPHPPTVAAGGGQQAHADAGVGRQALVGGAGEVEVQHLGPGLARGRAVGEPGDRCADPVALAVTGHHQLVGRRTRSRRHGGRNGRHAERGEHAGQQDRGRDEGAHPPPSSQKRF